MIRLAVRVRREDAEVALADLLELAPTGVEEVDLPDAGLVEYAVYGAPGELPELPDLRAAAGAALVDVRTSEVGDDWAVRWRAFHRPVLVDHRLLVRAAWHASGEGDVAEVVIDPGQAFGTGAHATTRLCLELLLELRAEIEPPVAVLDVGAGSGVLAIAAAILGWRPVIALDHDPAAVEATRANAVANGVETEARRWDLRRERLPEAPVVLANLVRPLLLALAERMAPPLPRALVASGLLAHEADEVAAAFALRHGLREHDRREGDGWAAVLLVG